MRTRNVAHKFLYPNRITTICVDYGDPELITEWAAFAQKNPSILNLHFFTKNNFFPSFDQNFPYDGCIINSRYSYTKIAPIADSLHIPLFLIQSDVAPDKKEHAYILANKQIYNGIFCNSVEAANAWYTKNAEIMDIYNIDNIKRIVEIVRETKYIK